MKKNCVLFLIVFLSINLFGQKVEHRKRTYLKIADYKKKFPNETIVFKKGNYQILNGDTLIWVKNHKPLEGVLVKYEPKDSLFLETYKDVVYQKFSNLNPKKKEYMKLWKTPIKIYFAPSLDRFYKEKIINAANYLSSNIDSLRISYTDTLENSNFVIYQIDEKNQRRYSKNMVNNIYVDYYILWNSARIYDAKLEINLKKFKHIAKEVHANYLLVNFYKTLGRFHESSRLPCESVFSTCRSNNKKLTPIDFEIIKYQYSYGICKFTDLETFSESHKKAKIELRNGREMRFLHPY